LDVRPRAAVSASRHRRRPCRGCPCGSLFRGARSRVRVAAHGPNSAAHGPT
jgi:hypothetical protein